MPHTIEDAMRKMPDALRQYEGAGLEAVLHFKFTGAEAGEWNAIIRDGKCDVAQGIPRQKPTVSLTADSDLFLGVLGGEVDATQAFMAGRIRLAGDMDLARRLLLAFAAR